MFVQILQPIGSGWLAAAIALSPLAVLLACLAGLRISAWAAVLLCAAMTVVLAVVVWDAPVGETLTAYGLGAATGLWSVDWIVFWGLIIYNTLLKVGGFAALRDWLVMAAGPDIRRVEPSSADRLAERYSAYRELVATDRAAVGG